MEDTKKLIGARIKALRRQAGMTQEVFAGKVEMDARHLSRLEVGRHYPSLDSLDRFATILGVPLIQFFDFPTNESTKMSRDYVVSFAKRATPAQLRAAAEIIRALVA